MESASLYYKKKWVLCVYKKLLKSTVCPFTISKNIDLIIGLVSVPLYISSLLPGNIPRFSSQEKLWECFFVHGLTHRSIVTGCLQ